MLTTTISTCCTWEYQASKDLREARGCLSLLRTQTRPTAYCCPSTPVHAGADLQISSPVRSAVQLHIFSWLWLDVVVLYCKVNLPLSTSHFSILDWLFCRHNVDCPGTFLEKETAKSLQFQVVWWGRTRIFYCVKDSFWFLHLFLICCLFVCFWGHISATVNLTTKSFLSFSLLFTQLSDPGACFFCYTSSITSHVSYDPSITSDTSTRRTFPFSCHTLLLYCTWYVLFRACRSLLQVHPKKV